MISSSMARGLQRANILSNIILQKLANLRYLKRERENEKAGTLFKTYIYNFIVARDLRPCRPQKSQEGSKRTQGSLKFLISHSGVSHTHRICFSFMLFALKAGAYK